MTIVLPYQGDVIDEGVDDFMVVDQDPDSTLNFNPAYSQYILIPIYIHDALMVNVAMIDQYQYFAYTDNWFDIDTWEMQVSRYATGVSSIVNGGFIRFVHNGQTKIGIIERIERPLGADGKASELWNIKGRGVESILQSRLCTYGAATGTGYHTLTATSATNCMRAYVNYNCIDPAFCTATRVITGLTLDPSPVADTTSLNYSARYQTVTDVLYDICTQTGLNYSLVWSGAGRNFIFTIKAGVDRTSTIKISPDFDNVSTINYQTSIADMKNFAYVGGTGVAAARAVSPVYVTLEPIGWSRRETWIEGSDCLDAAALAARGASSLALASLQTVLQVEYRESNTFKFGTDFFNGDRVTVIFPGVVTTTGQIISTTERFDSKGILTTLTIGKSPITLSSVLKNSMKTASVLART